MHTTEILTPRPCQCVGRRDVTDPHSKHCDSYPTAGEIALITYTAPGIRKGHLEIPAQSLTGAIAEARRIFAANVAYGEWEYDSVAILKTEWAQSSNYARI